MSKQFGIYQLDQVVRNSVSEYRRTPESGRARKAALTGSVALTKELQPAPDDGRNGEQ